MEEKIMTILNEMAEYLNVSQMKKLQEVILKVFSEKEAEKSEINNNEYLKMFLDAKRIEGCSDRTIDYYSKTITHMIATIPFPVRKVTTENMREYLSDYQKINNCSNVTVDNVRRNISTKEREAARLDSMVTAWIEGHPSTAAAACLLAGRYYK